MPNAGVGGERIATLCQCTGRLTCTTGFFLSFLPHFTLMGSRLSPGIQDWLPIICPVVPYFPSFMALMSPYSLRPKGFRGLFFYGIWVDWCSVTPVVYSHYAVSPRMCVDGMKHATLSQLTQHWEPAYAWWRHPFRSPFDLLHVPAWIFFSPFFFFFLFLPFFLFLFFDVAWRGGGRKGTVCGRNLRAVLAGIMLWADSVCVCLV